MNDSENQYEKFLNCCNAELNKSSCTPLKLAARKKPILLKFKS